MKPLRDVVDNLHRAWDLLRLVDLVFDQRTDDFAQAINAGLDEIAGALDDAMGGVEAFVAVNLERASVM